MSKECRVFIHTAFLFQDLSFPQQVLLLNSPIGLPELAIAHDNIDSETIQQPLRSVFDDQLYCGWAGFVIF